MTTRSFAVRAQLAALTLTLAAGATGEAWALPSFAQQTNLPCSSCHTVAFGPQLTPLGQQFKLGAYNLAGDKHSFVPIAGMVISSFTHTSEPQEGGPAPHFAPNDNGAIDETSLFFAGRITDHLGAFVQITYDGIERHLAWDNVDLRYARQATIGGKPLVWGLSLNNNPTVQDPWNTVPAWSFPYTSSGLAPTPAAVPMLEEAFAQSVYGLSAYALFDDLAYLEFGGYKTLATHLQGDFGIVDPEESDRIRGVAPYWRAALKHQFGANYVAAGVFGMESRIWPGGDQSSGSDRKTDLGYDATYIGTRGKHLFEAQATLIQELQQLPASFALDASAHPADHLQTRRINAEYVFDQTYAATIASFVTRGSLDRGLYAPAPIEGSATGNPESRGYAGELSWTPFGKAGSKWRPWLNLRVGVQYTWYARFNGGAADYDGEGRSARDNDTLFAFVWLAI